MEWPRLDELDDAVVTQAYEYVTQLLQERQPDADTQRGLLGSMVADLHAILHGSVRTAIQQVHDSLSVKDVLAKPERAKSALVDKLLANVGMTRSHVDVATGYIRIVVHRPVRVSIIQGELFKAPDGTYYCAEANAVFQPEDIPLQRGEMHLSQHGEKYACSIRVRANESGTVPPRLGTAFEPAIPPAGFFEAYAVGDFHGSYCLQTDVDALRLMRIGMTAPGYSNRAAIEAMVFKADPTQHRFAADVAALNITGTTGAIDIGVHCRDGVDVQGLVKELQAYLDAPERACLTAKVTVHA